MLQTASTTATVLLKLEESHNGQIGDCCLHYMISQIKTHRMHGHTHTKLLLNWFYRRRCHCCSRIHGLFYARINRICLLLTCNVTVITSTGLHLCRLYLISKALCYTGKDNGTADLAVLWVIIAILYVFRWLSSSENWGPFQQSLSRGAETWLGSFLNSVAVLGSRVSTNLHSVGWCRLSLHVLST